MKGYYKSKADGKIVLMSGNRNGVIVRASTTPHNKKHVEGWSNDTWNVISFNPATLQDLKEASIIHGGVENGVIQKHQGYVMTEVTKELADAETWVITEDRVQPSDTWIITDVTDTNLHRTPILTRSADVTVCTHDGDVTLKPGETLNLYVENGVLHKAANISDSLEASRAHERSCETDRVASEYALQLAAKAAKFEPKEPAHPNLFRPLVDMDHKLGGFGYIRR